MYKNMAQCVMNYGGGGRRQRVFDGYHEDGDVVSGRVQRPVASRAAASRARPAASRVRISARTDQIERPPPPTCT